MYSETIESLKLITRTTFDQNQFMTCYLIFNFRPVYFSYFQIIAESNSHNVEKTGVLFTLRFFSLNYCGVASLAYPYFVSRLWLILYESGFLKLQNKPNILVLRD